MKCNRFTLIELLVAVAIIGILLSILFPSIANARKLTQRAVCVNTQRQMGIFFYNCVETAISGVSFNIDKQEGQFFHFVQWRNSVANANSIDSAPPWHYFQRDMRCPKQPLSEYNYNYGLNAQFTKLSTKPHMSEIVEPSNLLWAGEVYEDFNLLSLGTNHAKSRSDDSRHELNDNASVGLFVDMHVSIVNWGQLEDATSGPRLQYP